MKPTVSVMITSRSRGKRSRRDVGSSVANILSSISTSRLGQRAAAACSCRRSCSRRSRAPAGRAGRGATRRSWRCLRELLEVALEARDAVAHAPAVDLELGLARAASADAAAEPRERRVALGQPRQQVLELGQLDLELAVPGRGALGEDVEDQLGAVDHAQVEALGEVARLGGREVVVEDHQVDVQLEAADHQVLELAPADHRLRVDPRPALDHVSTTLDPGRARQLAQLRRVDLGRPRRRGRPSPTTRIARSPSPTSRVRRDARQLLLEGPDQGPEVEVELRGVGRIEVLDRLAVDAARAQGGHVGQAGQPVVAGSRSRPWRRGAGPPGRSGRPGVKRRRRRGWVWMQRRPRRRPSAGAHAAPVRHLDAACVAHHHVGHVAAAIDQHAHLAAGLMGDGGQLASEFVA